MKIVNGPCVDTLTLKKIQEGDCLRFTSNLHSKHMKNDVFVRVEAISSYRPDSRKHDDTIAVVNLRSGSLAYVSPGRTVYAVEAELCVSE